jgi:DNA-directed RNA polymerase specialized sigma24 family protein
MERRKSSGEGSNGPRLFATTHWSVVLAAGRGTTGEAQTALETLCRAYWYPIYVYVRRKGHGPDDAQDLTQEFFSQLIRKEHLRLADRNKGRFRNFLLATLDYFLAREWSRAHRQKRGGQFIFISLDQQAADDRYKLEPADGRTPEEAYAKQWALTVLKQTMDLFERECTASGKGALFEATRHLLSGERGGAAYAEISARLGLAEGAIRVAVHRLRQRYAELLRSEIAQTVGSPEEVDEELQYLLSVLSK